jgi:hypothetical protein
VWSSLARRSFVLTIPLVPSSTAGTRLAMPVKQELAAWLETRQIALVKVHPIKERYICFATMLWLLFFFLRSVRAPKNRPVRPVVLSFNSFQ